MGGLNESRIVFFVITLFWFNRDGMVIQSLCCAQSFLVTGEGWWWLVWVLGSLGFWLMVNGSQMVYWFDVVMGVRWLAWFQCHYLVMGLVMLCSLVSFLWWLVRGCGVVVMVLNWNCRDCDCDCVLGPHGVVVFVVIWMGVNVWLYNCCDFKKH